MLRALSQRCLSVSCVALVFGLLALSMLFAVGHAGPPSSLGDLVAPAMGAGIGLLACAATLLVLLRAGRDGYPADRLSLATFLWALGCVPVVLLTIGVIRLLLL